MPSAVLHKKCKHLSKKNEHICLPLKNNDEKLPLKNNDNSNNNDNGTCVLLAHICDQHVTVRVPFWRRLFSACSRERCKKKAEPVQGCFCRGHANYTASMCVCARVDEVLFCRCLTTVTLCAAWMRVPAVRSHCWCGHCAVKPRPKDFPLCPRRTGEKKKKTLLGKNKKTHSKVVGSSCVSLQRELPFPWIDGAKEESRSPRTTSGLTLWRVGLFFWDYFTHSSWQVIMSVNSIFTDLTRQLGCWDVKSELSQLYLQVWFIFTGWEYDRANRYPPGRMGW